MYVLATFIVEKKEEGNHPNLLQIFVEDTFSKNVKRTNLDV